MTIKRITFLIGEGEDAVTVIPLKAPGLIPVVKGSGSIRIEMQDLSVEFKFGSVSVITGNGIVVSGNTDRIPVADCIAGIA